MGKTLCYGLLLAGWMGMFRMILFILEDLAMKHRDPLVYALACVALVVALGAVVGYADLLSREGLLRSCGMLPFAFVGLAEIAAWGYYPKFFEVGDGDTFAGNLETGFVVFGIVVAASFLVRERPLLFRVINELNG